MASRLHVARLHTGAARPAHCLALQPESKLLALSRNDGSIELWDVRGCPVFLREIVGSSTGSIEALCWSKDRLLSAGLSGAVVEWDLARLIPRRSVIVTGDAAWCLDVAQVANKLAVGTEQGYINIYSIDNDSIEFERIFDKQEGRILCCKFDPSGEILVTGSIETIRIWNVSTGQALHRMTTGRIERNKETIIWCLAVTTDLTVISGDSRGCITFWDARLGEQIESLTTHKADVLSICLSDDQNSLYCAGIDPLIINYTKVKMKHKGEQGQIEKWVKNIQRNIHQHDVRAMVVVGNKLFSGGVDGYLAMSSFPPKVLVKYPPINSNTAVSFSDNSKIVCLKYLSSIELWQLGSAHVNQKGSNSYSTKDDLSDDDEKSISVAIKNNREMDTYNGEGLDSNSGKRLSVANGPKLLLRLSTPSEAPLVCYAVSPNRKWIAFSTESHFRIFKFTMVDDSPTLSRLVPLPNECTPCYRMAFSPDSNSLIIGTADAAIRIIHIHKDGAIMIGHDIDANDVLRDSTLTHLITSENANGNGFYIVGADTASNVGVWEINNANKTPEFITRLPQYAYPPTALTINKAESNLIVAYSDQKLIEYSLVKLRYTKWSKSLKDPSVLGSRWKARMFPISGIDVHPTLPHILLTWDDCGIYVFNKNAEIEESYPVKKSKKQNANKDVKVCYVAKKYKHLVGAGWIFGENNDVETALILIEPTTLLENLPPVFYKKRFGCM